MDTPDYSAASGSDGAVAWQISSNAEEVQEPGETPSGSATGRVFDSSIEIAVFDRVRFDGELWEVRAVNPWLSFRTVRVTKVTE